MAIDDGNLFSNEELEVLMVFFLDQALLILETMNKSLLVLEENSADEEAFNLLQRSLHTLKGDANSVGLVEVGTMAHRLEDLLALFNSAEEGLKREIFELLLSGADALADMLQRKSRSPYESVDSGEVLEKIESFINEHEEKKKRAVRPSLVPVKLTEYETLQIKKASAKEKEIIQIEAHFIDDCTMRAAGAYILFRHLRQIGEIVTSYPSLDEDELLEQSSHITIVIITESPRAVRKTALVPGVIKEALILPMKIDSGEVILMTDLLSQSGDQNPSLAEMTELIGERDSETALPGNSPKASAKDLLSAIGQSDREITKAGVLAEASPLAPERPGQASTKVSTEILRVDAGKVDSMMNLVGELMIGRSMLNQICGQLKGEFSKHDKISRLVDLDSYIGRLVGELQKSVIQVRMVSLDQIFNRFFRVVRDLARENGKLINLEIIGEDTEMDKRVADLLYEPLLHLIRNGVDHGIESIEGRSAAGKSQHAHITLRAYYEGDQVIIEVEDDGRGIDVEKLKAKTLEKGLRTAEELKTLDGQDLFELIFLSGLSTAERVTKVSGRGVGMDVVKTVITSLKGTIEIWSEVGKGTRFTLRLPLTLAIIRAILVAVDDRVFAIPLSSVVEIVRVRDSEMEQIGQHKVYSLRDTVYSLIELDRLLLRGKRRERRHNPFILIVGIGEKRVGLIVDHVIGEREIVVKPIDREWISSDLVTGASILGDGRVVLILDIGVLLRRAASGYSKA
jgi:two-component system, chemotaxis family, sensor kinase CheA